MKEKKRRWNRSLLLKSTSESSKLKPHAVPLLPLVNQEKNYTIQDQWKLDLLARLQNISIKCKSLCTINNMDEYTQKAIVVDTFTNTKDRQDNLATNSIKKAYVTLQASVDCKSLFQMNELDAGDRTFP
ncbi:predicted protein [Chaetoceros tenuissimus]|nr:predicted protein [Chaetoceros tenuissimus]